MTPTNVVERLSKSDVEKLLRRIGERHFGGYEQLLAAAENGELDVCEDAEILTLIAMLGKEGGRGSEQRCST